MENSRKTPFLLWLIVALPLVFLGDNVHYGHAHALIIGSFLVLSIYLPNRFLRLFCFYLAGWMIYNLIQAFLGRSIFSASATLVLYDSVIYPLCAVIIYLAIYKSGYDWRIFMNCLCIGAIIQAAVGMGQHFGCDAVFAVAGQFVRVRSELPPNTAYGFLGNNNFLAAYLAISLPFFFRKRWVWFLPVIIYALILAHTRTAIVAAIIGVSYYAVRSYMDLMQIQALGRRSQAAVALVILLLLAAYWFGLENRSGIGDRPEMWLDAIKKVSQSWATLIFGFGPIVVWKVGDQLHNQYVITLFNYGLIGLGLMISFILTAHRGNRLLYASFIILCVNMIGNHALSTVPTALSAITIAALIERADP